VKHSFRYKSSSFFIILKCIDFALCFWHPVNKKKAGTVAEWKKYCIEYTTNYYTTLLLPISNKTDDRDVTEVLLKLVLSTNHLHPYTSINKFRLSLIPETIKTGYGCM
jgi:hypothetical protein